MDDNQTYYSAGNLWEIGGILERMEDDSKDHKMRRKH